MASRFLTTIVIAILLVQGVGGQTASPNAATCSLKLRGRNLAGDEPKYDEDSKLTDQGVQGVQLTCSTDPPGQQVPISVNRTWISSQQSSGFKGVTVVPNNAACQRAITAQTQIFGLLNFCGDYDLTFSSVDIADLHVHAPITSGVDDAISWGLAVVLLGKQVRARVEQARAVHNSVLSVFVVKDSAQLLLGPGVAMSHNRGVWGSCVHAMGSSSVVVNGSQMSHNFAHNSGGSITGRDQSTVLVTGGARISFGESRVWGGALQADGSANVTVAGGSIIHNNKAQYGGAAALKSSALVHVKGPRTTIHSNKAQLGGGGVAAQHYTTILSTDGAIWRNNSAQSGGAAAGQNDVNITFDSNSLVTECHAQYGGAAAVADTGVIVFKGNTTLLRNRASWKGAGAYGGVAAAQGQSTVYFYKSNVLGNTAGCGGVVALQNLCHMKAFEGSLFSGNVAEAQGGVVCAMELSDVTFNGSRAINNSSPKGLGGVIALEARTEAFIGGNTIMANNSAGTGGAISLMTYSSIRLEGNSVLSHNEASGDGGAVYLGPGTSLNVSLGAGTYASTSPAQEHAAPTRGPRIFGNRAGEKGGGVLFDGEKARIDKALRTIATGNNAKYDLDISTPLQRIDTLSPGFIQLASRRNRTDTMTIVVKLTGHLGVPSGGVRVQAALQGPRGAGVLQLAAATSNVSGVAELRDVKLRVKAGYHTILISAPDARSVRPATVVVAVRMCIIGETTNELGDACDTCGPGTFSLNPANYSCDSCPSYATCKGGAQIVPEVGYWSSSQLSPQVHPCPNPEACSGDRRALLSCEVVPAQGWSNSSAAMTALRSGVGDARSFAFRCMRNATQGPPMPGGTAAQQRRGLLSSTVEDTLYLTQAETRKRLCSKGYSGNVCGSCESGFGQSAPFTCYPCLKRSTSLVLYVTAFIAALLMVRLLTWLTILDNNASATAAAAMPQTAKAAAAQPAASKAPKDPTAQPAAPSTSGRIKVWAKGLLQGLSHCRGSSSSDADGSCEVEAQLPEGAWSASTKSSGPDAACTSSAASALPPTSSGSAANSGAAASAALASAASVSSQASGGAAASYLARASDIFRVLVLYIQYMVIIANLRVAWPVTLSYPSKAFTWLYSVGSSQALSLECVYEVHGRAVPADIQRQLVYFVMPLAVFAVLWLAELLVRCRSCLLPTCGRRRVSRSSTLGSSTQPKPAFLHFGTLTLVLFMVTIFFFLPALVRSGLSLFACIPLDDPNATPYAWAGLAPGSYWVAGPNQPCWSGWHAKWAWCFGAPVVMLLCMVIPISIFALVAFNRHRLDSPELKRNFGFLYRQYKPNRAAWEAVVVCQTTILCVVAVFGLALGPHYQTLTMAAFCAFNLVMLLGFEPYKHRQQHRVQLFSYSCIFVMCFVALSFIPSFDGKVPPEQYKTAAGAVVLALNLVFIAWALWQLKLCLVEEFRSFWRSLSSKASVVTDRARILTGRWRHGRRQRRAPATGQKAKAPTQVVNPMAGASAPSLLSA